MILPHTHEPRLLDERRTLVRFGNKKQGRKRRPLLNAKLLLTGKYQGSLLIQ